MNSLHKAGIRRLARLCAIIGALCAAVFITLFIFGYVSAHTEIPHDHDNGHNFYRVASITDGDTFKIRLHGAFRTGWGARTVAVRMLGIDTPETVDPRTPPQCFGVEASAASKQLLNGRQVRLVFSPNREQTDRYGRYLAYVYRDDGLFVNERLLADGLAREYTVGTPYSLQSEFRRLEKTARKGGEGLWSACAAPNEKKE